MGKQSRSSTKLKRDSLQAQLKEDLGGNLRPAKPGFHKKPSNSEENGKTTTDAALSSRILKIARQQQEEEQRANSNANLEPSLSNTSVFREDGNVSFDEVDDAESACGSEEDLDEDAFYENLDIAQEDQVALNAFMPSQSTDSRFNTLTDLIMQKLDDYEKEGPQVKIQQEPIVRNDKIIDAYTKVGYLLSRYKSGPLPKAFKILPSIPAWPALLEITQPDHWTPHATLAATKIFASNLDPKQTQRFYKTVLLPRIRDDIQETKKLSVHLYQALKKALYKPSAFFKGLLFPLCENGTCTLREAAIIGSIITKISIPVLHSGAALLKLAEMDYTGPNSLFIRVLLDKKYALPYKVVDALVSHFMRFKMENKPLPVLWHQSLLVFAQRYKSDITRDQRDALLDVIRVKTHPQIAPEIRRELLHGIARGETLDEIMLDVW